MIITLVSEHFSSYSLTFTLVIMDSPGTQLNKLCYPTLVGGIITYIVQTSLNIKLKLL